MMIGMWSLKELVNSLGTLLNVNTCTNFRTGYRVLEVDLRIPRLLRWRSLKDFLIDEGRKLIIPQRPSS